MTPSLLDFWLNLSQFTGSPLPTWISCFIFDTYSRNFSFSFLILLLFQFYGELEYGSFLWGIERQQVFTKLSWSVILFEPKPSTPFFCVQSPPHFSLVIKAFHTFVLNSSLFRKGKIVIYFIVVFSVVLSF